MPVLHSHADIPLADAAQHQAHRDTPSIRNPLASTSSRAGLKFATGSAASSSSSSSTSCGLQPCYASADAPLTFDATEGFKCVMGKCMCHLTGECCEIESQTWTSHVPTYAQDASVIFMQVPRTHVIVQSIFVHMFRASVVSWAVPGLLL
jgi:hypothetical protein